MRKTSLLIHCISISLVLLFTTLQALGQSPTTTTISSSTNPSITGNNVVFTATVTASGNPVTIGTVTFKEGATILAASVALNASGQASFNTNSLNEGNHIITADYNGSVNFNLSNGSINQRVNNPTVVNANQFCNSASGITFRDNNTATPYPSNITVSGLSGTITKLTVSLNGFISGNAQDIDLLLVGPGGQKFILLSDVGGTTIASNINLTLDDAASNILPSSTLTSGTYRPTDYAIGNADNFFAPAPAGPYVSAAPNGTATFASVFNGTNANGTWSLYAIDDLTGNSVGSISGGWCLNFTTSSSPSTTTTITSSINPSATGNNVVFTATVTSLGNPVTVGTVTFKEGATILAANVALNGNGQASFNTNALNEGNHIITADYNGSIGFNISNGSMTQRVNNPTVVNGNQFCNSASGITFRDNNTATPYPSNITVSGLSGTITKLTVSLNGFSAGNAEDIDLLLVGPGGQKFILLSDVGGTNAANNINLTLDDAAANILPTTALSSVTFRPADYAIGNADNFFAPAPAGPYNSAAPNGTATFASVFNGTNPNGTWSLYAIDDLTGNSVGSISGGWCLTFGDNTPCPQFAAVSQAAFTICGTDSTSDISLTATENNVNVKLVYFTSPTATPYATPGSVLLATALTPAGGAAPYTVNFNNLKFPVNATNAQVIYYVYALLDTNDPDLTNSNCRPYLQFTVTSDPAAIIDAGPDQFICATDTIQFNATLSGLATNMVWQKNVAYGVFIGPDTETNARFVLNANGRSQPFIKFGAMTNDPGGNVCQGGLDTVIIYISPAAIADAGVDIRICQSTAEKDGVQLNGQLSEQATTARWSGGNGQFSPDANTLNAVYHPTADEITNGSVTLYLTTNDPEGICGPGVDSVKIRIDPAAIINAGPDQFICNGDIIYLKATLSGVATNMVWQKNAAFGVFLDPDTNPETRFQLNDAGKALDFIKFGAMTNDPGDNVCQGGLDTVIIYLSPAAIVNAGDEIRICQSNAEKDGVQLNGQISEQATSAQWSGGNGQFSPDANTLNAVYRPTADEITNGSVTLYLTTNDPDGICGPGVDSVKITIDPAAIIDAGPDQFICATDTIQFNATLSGLATNMVWQKNVAYGVFIGPDTETNARFVLNANGRSQPFIKFGAMTNDPGGNVCQGGLDTVIIYISPAAIADAGVDIRICQSTAEKDGVQLNGQISEQATTAQWSGGNGQFSPDANTLNAVYHPTADEITTGSVTLYLTTNDPEGICGPGVDSVKIRIDPAAIINAGPDQFICNGDIIYLKATLSGVATNMVWQKNVEYGVFLDPDTNPETRFQLNEAGKALGFIKFGAMTNDPGDNVCDGGVDTVTIFINKLPVVTIEGTAGPVCPSSSNDYTAPPNMSQYKWEIISGDASIVSGEEDDKVATVIAGTTCNSTYVLKLTVTDANGCSNTLTKEVTINDTEAPVITTQFLNKTSLWPPNHKMVDVTLTPATDNCEVKLTNINITSNEPVDTIGDGSSQVDWEIVDATHIRLRAERSGVFNVNANDFGRVYTITYTATDACGNSSTGTNTVIVGHNIIAPKPGANAFKIGTTVSLAGTFWDIPGKKHTAKWIIDGTSVSGVVNAEPSGNKTGKVSGSFKPTSAGVYKLRMNVTDQNNNTSYATTSGASEAFLVAYDPKGGYTYGAAQFISPKGALSSNPNASGKVSFGFTSNYFKNATNPKGETEFEFKMQDFEFTALNFDYLVISGAKGQFKGLGKVIRSGVEQSGYAFIMTVIDGQLPDGAGVDKIRLKIYHKNTGAVIYDNQKGAADNADPTTTIDAPKADGTDIVIVNIPTTTSQSLKSASNTVVEAESSLRVNVSPNPTESIFTLNVSSKNLSDFITIRLMNINGLLLKVIKGKPGESFRFGTELAKGVYIAEVRQGNEKRIVRLIKF